MREHVELLYILSTKAGNGESKNLREHLYAIADKRDLHVSISVVETEHENHATEAAQDFAARSGEDPSKIRVVYVLGGDGTSNEVASVLAGTSTAIGVLPAGTANDFAKQLYPKGARIRDLLQRSLTPVLEPIDLISVNDGISLNVASFGFDTVVLEQAYRYLKRFPRLGRFAYVLAVMRCVFQKKSYFASWEILDHEQGWIRGEGAVTLGTIANGGYYGDGFRPAPNAVLDDGLLDIGIAAEVLNREVLGLVLQYKKGTHIGHPKVRQYKATEGVFRAKPGEELLANKDGIIIREKELRFKVLPKKILLARI